MNPSRAHAMDHVVLVLFENRSFDNLLGRLYAPGEVEAFEGVVGKDLCNPVPDWAEHAPPAGVVPYGIATGMDQPDPDPGEEYPHTNTQLFNVLDEANRGKDASEMVAPYNAPPPGRRPTMDGFVTDYISFLTVELGRQPTPEEYGQIMTGYTPSRCRSSARSPGASASSTTGSARSRRRRCPTGRSGRRRRHPVSWSTGRSPTSCATTRPRRSSTAWNGAAAHGRSTSSNPARCRSPVSSTCRACRDRFATHFVPFAEFERDAAGGTLPDFSLIEPNLMAGHGDYHPAFGRALIPGLEVLMDAPSSILAGEAFLGRIYDAMRSATSPTGSNAFNTMLLVGFDEPGGTYDHVPPGPVPPPDPGRAARAARVRLRPLGLRVPAVVVSPWVPEGTICTDEHRHTSLLATLRSVWDLGDPFTARDAAARTFEGVCSLEVPRPPDGVARRPPAPGPRLPGGAGGRHAGARHPRASPVPRPVRARAATTRTFPIRPTSTPPSPPPWPSTSPCASVAGCSPS